MAAVSISSTLVSSPILARSSTILTIAVIPSLLFAILLSAIENNDKSTTIPQSMLPKAASCPSEPIPPRAPTPWDADMERPLHPGTFWSCGDRMVPRDGERPVRLQAARLSWIHWYVMRFLVGKSRGRERFSGRGVGSVAVDLENAVAYDPQ